MSTDAIARERVAFSDDGARLAVCSSDGEVKIWSSATGTLVARFTPEGSRGTAVAAASWSGCFSKQRKSGQKIAVAVGSKVVVWNASKGRQECVLSGVHTGAVTDVAWGPGNSCLYSAAQDKFVAEWNTGTWDCAHKWQADRHGVTCVCCHGDRNIIATAGRSMKLWSCKDYSLIKRFSGHSTSVCSLAFIGDNLLLSCARDDRVINLWSSEVKGSSSVASFTCEEEVLSAHVTVSMGTVHAVALTQEGVAHMFKYPLTNQIAAPISAHSTLQYTTPPTKSGTPSPLAILAVWPSPSGLTLAHGSTLRPVIETMRWSECEGGRVCLVREEVKGLLLPGPGDQRTSGRKTHSRSVTVLGPDHMTPATVTTETTNQLVEDAPLSSRLAAEGVASSEGSSRVASAESLGRLLGQAIQSGDRSLLEEALRVRREVVLRQTLRRLPLPLILPLLKQLVRLLETSPGRGLELSLWVKHLLTQHSSYLTTQPQLVSTLSSFYQVLEVRSSVYNKLCRIHGKLDLMNIHEPDEGPSEVTSEPLVTATVGEQVIAESSSEQSDDQMSDLESDQSEGDSNVSMDTTEHKRLT